MKKICFVLLLSVALQASLPGSLQARSGNKTFVDLEVFIDSSDYFYYYYTFNFMRKALDIDAMSMKLQSLSTLWANMEFSDATTDDEVPKIYFIVIYERNLEKYNELLELLDARSHLLLWIVKAEGEASQSSIPDIALDATTSASSTEASLQDFRSEILPKLMTLYMEKTRIVTTRRPPEKKTLYF